jgi:hypothetical protein
MLLGSISRPLLLLCFEAPRHSFSSTATLLRFVRVRSSPWLAIINRSCHLKRSHRQLCQPLFRRRRPREVCITTRGKIEGGASVALCKAPQPCGISGQCTMIIAIMRFVYNIHKTLYAPKPQCRSSTLTPLELHITISNPCFANALASGRRTLTTQKLQAQETSENNLLWLARNAHRITRKGHRL